MKKLCCSYQITFVNFNTSGSFLQHFNVHIEHWPLFFKAVAGHPSVSPSDGLGIYWYEPINFKLSLIEQMDLPQMDRLQFQLLVFS